MNRLKISQPVLNLVAIWLAWALIVIGFQAIARARVDLKRPDTVLPWTVNETQSEKLKDRVYLIDPFMNQQVAWDSEYYLSIATVGYDDPNVSTAPPEWRPEFAGHDPVPLNYAFFPFYPLVMRVVRIPLLVLGQTPIATSTLAGVIVSLVGTLGALLALAPLIAYFVWRAALGAQFDFVETSFFGRGPFQLSSLQGWREALNVVVMGKEYRPIVQPECWQFAKGVTPQNQAHYVFEFSITVFAVAACFFTLRRYPGLALFGLAALVISFFSGNPCVAQGMPRYALAVPSVFIALARWGRNAVFDRAWMVASVLLMGLLALVFAFNFWVG